jgi:hypothetical protein
MDDLKRALDVDMHYVSSQFIRKFGPVLVDWFNTAAIAHAGEILTAADSHFMKAAMDDLGLRQQWSRLRLKSDASARIAQAFVAALARVDPPHAAMHVAKIVFTWWGRQAVRILNDSTVTNALNQQVLPYRFAEATQGWAHTDESVRSLIKDLDRQPPLNHLFASLWESAALREGGDEFRKRLGQIECSSITDTAATEEHQASESAAKQDLAPTAFPTDPPRPLNEGALDLSAIRSGLERCRILKNTVSERLEAGDIAGSQRALLALEDLKSVVQAKITDVRTYMLDSGLQLDSAAAPVFTSENSADAFLASMTELSDAAYSSRRAALDSAISALKDRFNASGLKAPDELFSIQSQDDLNKICGAWSVKFATADVYRALQHWPDALPEEYHGLPQEARLDVLESLMLLPSTELGTIRLMQWAVGDVNALLSDAQRGIAFLTGLIVNAIEKYLIPPADGIWDVYGSLVGPDAAKLLFATDLGRVVAAAVDSDIVDVGHLVTLPSWREAPLPREVERAVCRHSLKVAPAGSDLTTFAALALRAELSAQVVGLLVDKFAANGRDAEALAVAILGVRARRLPSASEALSSAFARILVKGVLARPELRELGRQLLDQDYEWLTDTPERTAVLLFLASEVGAERPVVGLTYQDPELLESARARWPALVGRWLLERRLSSESSQDVARLDELRQKAADALKDWDRDLTRPFLRSARRAAAYQTSLNDRLHEAFVKIDSGEPEDDVLSEDWLEHAWSVSGLPGPDGDVLPQIRTYLHSQASRLRMLQQCRAETPRNITLRQALGPFVINLHDALRIELAREPETSMLRPVYTIALVETQ